MCVKVACHEYNISIYRTCFEHCLCLIIESTAVIYATYIKNLPTNTGIVKPVIKKCLCIVKLTQMTQRLLLGGILSESGKMRLANSESTVLLFQLQRISER